MTESSVKRKKNFVPRVLQLDAESFDDQIKTLLHNQVLEISKYFKPGTLDTFKSEINLILNLLIFKYSIVNKNTTFGQDIFNLKYKDKFSTKKLTAFALLSYVFPYLNSKLQDKSTKLENRMLEKAAKRIHIFCQVCTILNLVVFLRKGKYPTLIDRLLNLQYAPSKPINTNFGYHFMIKELLWQGIMAFLTNVLPFVNMTKIKRKIKTAFQNKSKQPQGENRVHLNLKTKCVVCNEFPMIPCQISIYCTHVACYYCIKSNILADDKFMCPVCGESYYGFQESEFTLLDWYRRGLCLSSR